MVPTSARPSAYPARSGHTGLRTSRRRVQLLLMLTGIGVVGLQVGFAGAAQAATATTRYVDRGSSACTDSGTGTAAAPYCTIKPAAAAAQAGDTVLVHAGTYAETVTPARSGTSGAPITYAAAPGETVTVTGGSYGFKLSSRSWITVSGFNVTHTSSQGIYGSSSSHLVLSRNNVSFAGQPASGSIARGIYLSGVTDSTVTGNVTHHNTDAGIYLAATTTRVVVDGNESYANARGYTRAAPGIDIRGFANTVTANRCHDNEDSGIQSYSGAHDNVIAANITYANGDHGIDDLGATDQTITGNTVYGNVTAGINAEGGSTGVRITNNISMDNGIASPRTHSDIRVDKDSTSGSVVDSNLVFLTKADTVYVWGTTSYKTLAAFQAATKQEQHGIFADPGFVAAGSGDLRLRAGSPAIDSADSAAPAEQLLDAAGNGRVDDPATANSGSGPRSFDDRGALEFQP